MINLDELERSLLAEAEEDHLGLWSLIWEVRYALNDGQYPERDEDKSNPVDVRDLTLRLVEKLLDSGRIVAGKPTPDGQGFIPWSEDKKQAMARIAKEWDALGREPNIGEIV